MGAHGVSDDGGKVLQFCGALQKLAGHAFVQLRAACDDFTQDHLLKLGPEGVVDRLFRHDHRAGSQTWTESPVTLLESDFLTLVQYF